MTDPDDNLPPAEPTPMGTKFGAVAARLKGFFPVMDVPPQSRAEEREYHRYTADMTAQLHLAGDRENLELARLTLFDRIGAPEERLVQQAEMVREFLASTLDVHLDREVTAFLADARGENRSPVMKAFAAKDKELKISREDSYGKVVMTVVRREQGS